jgi:hypothetical protein
MRTIHFPEWPEVLAQAELPGRLKHSFEISIRWYLSFCRRGRAEVTVLDSRELICGARNGISRGALGQMTALAGGGNSTFVGRCSAGRQDGIDRMGEFALRN